MATRQKGSACTTEQAILSLLRRIKRPLRYSELQCYLNISTERAIAATLTLKSEGQVKVQQKTFRGRYGQSQSYEEVSLV